MVDRRRMGEGEKREELTAASMDRRPSRPVPSMVGGGGAETYGDEGAGAGQGGAGRPWACRACMWWARHHLSAVSMFFTDRTYVLQCTKGQDGIHWRGESLGVVPAGSLNLSWWVHDRTAAYLARGPPKSQPYI